MKDIVEIIIKQGKLLFEAEEKIDALKREVAILKIRHGVEQMEEATKALLGHIGGEIDFEKNRQEIIDVLRRRGVHIRYEDIWPEGRRKAA